MGRILQVVLRICVIASALVMLALSVRAVRAQDFTPAPSTRTAPSTTPAPNQFQSAPSGTVAPPFQSAPAASATPAQNSASGDVYGYMPGQGMPHQDSVPYQPAPVAQAAPPPPAAPYGMNPDKYPAATPPYGYNPSVYGRSAPAYAPPAYAQQQYPQAYAPQQYAPQQYAPQMPYGYSPLPFERTAQGYGQGYGPPNQPPSYSQAPPQQQQAPQGPPQAPAYGYLPGQGPPAYGAQYTADPQAYYQQPYMGSPLSASYRLGPGDKVRVTVFGETDLSGEYEIDGTGQLRLPLIGAVPAAGATAPQLEYAVGAALSRGYLKNPKVNVEITTYRPFYIVGAVNKPGEYPYVEHMSAMKAVALAGGFTDNASQGTVYVRHEGEREEEEVDTDKLQELRPGDTIRVKNSWFASAMSVFTPLAPAAIAAAALHP